MDEVTIGHGFDGLNRVLKLGSIITQFEAGDGGPDAFFLHGLLVNVRLFS